MLGHPPSHSNSAGSPVPTAFCSKSDLFQDQATSISSLLSPGFLFEIDLTLSSLLQVFHNLEILSIRQMAYSGLKQKTRLYGGFFVIK